MSAREELRAETLAFQVQQHQRAQAALTPAIEAVLDAAFPTWRREPELARLVVHGLEDVARHYARRQEASWRPFEALAAGREFVHEKMQHVAAEYAGEGLPGASDYVFAPPERIQHEREHRAALRRVLPSARLARARKTA